MKWISKALVVTTFLWLTGSIGNALAQESPCEPIDLEPSRYSETSVPRDSYPAKDVSVLCEEISLKELESIAGKGLGDRDRPYFTARIILGDEVDVERVSGTAFHNHGGSSLNVQMNTVVIGTN